MGILKSVARLPLRAGSVGSMTVRGSQIFVCRDRVEVIELDTGTLRRVASWSTAMEPRRVAIDDRYAYVALEGGVEILDVARLDQPRRVSLLVLDDMRVRDIAVVGDLLAFTGEGALRLWDVSDRAHPKALSEVAIELPKRFVAHGKLMLVTADYNGLRIVDVGDPRHPSEVGSLEGPGDAACVAVAGNCALVGDYAGGGLYLVDIANPRRPRKAGLWQGGGIIGDVTVAGAVAYVAMGDLRAIDVSNPAQPKEVAAVESGESETFWSVALVGELVVGLGEAGLGAWNRA